MVVGATISCIGAYLMGSIPFGVILSSLFVGKDPSRLGSGNIGATNVYRSVSKAVGLATLAGDVMKGACPLWLTRALFPGPYHPGELLLSLVGLCTFMGHLFPIFRGFRGGKGVSTGAGVFMVLGPWALMVCIPLFILTIMISGYISVGSMASALALPLAVWILYGYGPPLILSLVFLGWVLIRHRDNIQRLKRGTEIGFRP